VKVIVKCLSARRRPGMPARQSMELPEGATVRDVLNSILDESGQALSRDYLPVLLVNQDKASLETNLKDGDEVYLLYPLGGG